ncbi:MAG TPA: hypothetical protein VII33_16120 [Nakamurella sp.]
MSGDSITFSYAPAGCIPPSAGLYQRPAGMLCAVTAWDGTKTALSYVTIPGGGIQVGRITAYSGSGMIAQPADFGWDNLGRVASLRQPLADDAIASGVVSGLTAPDPRATTAIGYDAQGRVTSIIGRPVSSQVPPRRPLSRSARCGPSPTIPSWPGPSTSRRPPGMSSGT